MRTCNKEINQSQSESIKIDQICDVTYIACRFDEQLNEPVLEITYQKQLKLCTHYRKVDVQSMSATD